MRRTWMVAGVLAIVSACGGGEVAQAPSSPSPSPPSSPDASPLTSAGRTDLADGRHAVNITDIDVAGRRISVDVIQWLSGEDARKAYEEETGDPEGPPNDYFIRNANERIRTLDVAEDVNVRLVRLLEDSQADLDPGTFDELPEYLPNYGWDEDPSCCVFWLALRDGVVVEIEEQFRP